MSRIVRRCADEDEAGRQCALDRLHVLDTPPEPAFEKITSLVTTILDVPVAAVSLMDRGRQWFKAIQGLEVSETSREIAFCDHTIRGTQYLTVEDATLDPRFMANPLVTGSPHIRAYLGAPIITSDGYAIGALCAIDFRPRHFLPEQGKVLSSFAGLVMNELELRQVATCDSLTELATRRAFVDAVDMAARAEGEAALILLDLDRFKAINDTYGHPVGDKVLKAAASALLKICPKTAVAGRLGGEEMGLLLPGASETVALETAEILRSAIENARIAEYPNLCFTTSIGVAIRGAHDGRGMWMAAADAALYDAKLRGRNRVQSAQLAFLSPAVPSPHIANVGAGV